MHIKLELLLNSISDVVIQSLKNVSFDADQIADTTAINALSEIQTIIQKDHISDFDAVEEIVNIFEKYNISAGTRHDFG